MSGGDRPGTDHEHLVRLLCDQVRTLAAQLPPGLRQLSLRAGDCEVSVSVEPPAVAPAAALPAEQPAPSEPATSPHDEAETGDTTPVTAPLVGTFYRSSEPGADPFVEVGDLVEEGQVVAIIEAMKLMNRIESTARGRVVAILVEDKEMVEHGQPLLLLGPDTGEGDETDGGDGGR